MKPSRNPSVKIDPRLRVGMIARLFCAVSLFAAMAADVSAEAVAGAGVGENRATGEDGADGCLAGRLERSEDAAVEAAKAWDEATGRNRRNFPPDPVVDFLHMTLQMRFENLNDRKFTAEEKLTFAPIGAAARALVLDSDGLKIQSVRMAGKPVEFSTDDEHLTLRFEPPLAAGEQASIDIDYVCDHPSDGMTFTPSSPDAPNYSAEVHTQGETDFNHHWFVCHDFPNDRLSTELIVDVPAGFQVSSNGRLVSNLTSGDRAIWHYLQEKPHCAYLVSLVIGKFDVVEIPHSRVPMHVWVPQGLGGEVMQSYGRTGRMIDLFEKRFGTPYPWDRYDQLCVKNFGAGGMENTSATSMYPTAVFDKAALLDGDLDGLISHELCHQWTGDYITCKSWEHIWLNEGWATMGSALWAEERDGEDGYLDAIRGNFRVAERDKTANDLPMVSNVYEQPGETFRRPANPYPKGASILHMLRMTLGEDVFWKGVQLYFKRHGLGVAETSDFRYALEEASGRSLEWFFDQWCSTPGCPELAVKIQYAGETRELLVDVTQNQKIDEKTPAFRFTLPVWVRTASGDRTVDINVSEKTTSFRTTLDGPPSLVVVDPWLHVLKTITTDKTMAMWELQAAAGPTIAARHEAVGVIGASDTPDHISLLVKMVNDDKIRHTLRDSAVDALAGYASPAAKEALLAIAKSNLAEAKVRSQVVEKLREYPKEQVVELLADFASKDPSYATRVAAIEGLAKLKAADKADGIAALVDFPSQHDQVCNAALRALADLDDKRGLDLAMRCAAYGHIDRARPAAIDVVGRLAKHDKDKAVMFLIGLLHDPESRTAGAAAGALADIGDDRALQPLEEMSKTHPDPDMRKRMEGALKRLQEKKKA